MKNFITLYILNILFNFNTSLYSKDLIGNPLNCFSTGTNTALEIGIGFYAKFKATTNCVFDKAKQVAKCDNYSDDECEMEEQIEVNDGGEIKSKLRSLFETSKDLAGFIKEKFNKLIKKDKKQYVIVTNEFKSKVNQIPVKQISQDISKKFIENKEIQTEKYKDFISDSEIKKIEDENPLLNLSSASVRQQNKENTIRELDSQIASINSNYTRDHREAQERDKVELAFRLEMERVAREKKKRQDYLSSLSYTSECQKNDPECFKIVADLQRREVIRRENERAQRLAYLENKRREEEDRYDEMKRTGYKNNSACKSAKRDLSDAQEAAQAAANISGAFGNSDFQRGFQMAANNIGALKSAVTIACAAAGEGDFREVMGAISNLSRQYENIRQTQVESNFNNDYRTQSIPKETQPVGNQTDCGFSQTCTQATCNQIRQLESFIGGRTGNGLGGSMQQAGLSEDVIREKQSQVNTLRANCGW